MIERDDREGNPFSADEFEEKFNDLQNKACEHFKQQFTENLVKDGIPNEFQICSCIAKTYEEDLADELVKVVLGKSTMDDWRRQVRSVIMFNLAMPLVRYATQEYLQNQIEKEINEDA